MPTAPKFPLRVYYDGSCVVCATEIERCSRMDHAGRLVLVDVSARDFDPDSLGITLDEFMYQMYAIAATQADAQGIHETGIRAGEERILRWIPALKPGEYTVKARLIYDLIRYNERSFKEDQAEINSTNLSIKVKKG